MAGFSHFGADGSAIMVDVGDKEPTRRQAVATGRIRLSRECFEAVRAGTVGKGDVLGVARIAGIMAVKQTPSLIPLCHVIPIERVAVEFAFHREELALSARCTVATTGVTGAEMEALTGVSAVLLTVYDMCKAMDKGMTLEQIRLEEKSGGKSGAYRREELAP